MKKPKKSSSRQRLSYRECGTRSLRRKLEWNSPSKSIRNAPGRWKRSMLRRRRTYGAVCETRWTSSSKNRQTR